MSTERHYIDIPGTKQHELPPLLVHSRAGGPGAGDMLDHAALIVESEEILPDIDADEQTLEQRKFDLAVKLADQYRGLVDHWHWGDSILAWIRQCEITFESEAVLRHLLHPDVWPHASRSSFVRLLIEKAVGMPQVAVDQAVGLRLTFRQPPPIDCFSNQFLFYLNSTLAGTAYRTWDHLNPDAVAMLPPERFYFQVLELGASLQ